MTYLLDTNVISEIRKRNADPGVTAWFAATRADELHLSVLTVGEIRHGIERLRRRDPSWSDVLDAWLTTLQHDFADRLLPVTSEIANVWGRLGVPDPIALVDGFLDATAVVHGLTFVTCNTVDLTSTGARLLNPFQNLGTPGSSTRP